MLPAIKSVMDLVKKEEIEFIDLRFSDLRGTEHHVSIPASRLNEELFTFGKVFDGSSIEGWANIDDSDLILRPIPESAVIDPFAEARQINLRCNIYDPATDLQYVRDPRRVAQRAEEYLRETGIADEVLVGTEFEFFVLDDVRWSIDMQGVSYRVDSDEAAWNTDKETPGGNMGHRPGVKGGYFPVPPVDSSQDLRSAMCLTLAEMGLVPEIHHHEVATSNQNEITIKYNTLLAKADEVQIFKYCVRNVADSYGKTVTFMPKPIVGDNGSALHCHQSLVKNGKNIFSGDSYAGLSEVALFYLGGLLKHARALNAFTNPSTNSYKRLVPGFEAPVKIAYSKSNRSAAVRIPHVGSAHEKRIEARFPDPLTNSYLGLSAMVMAGLDGIKNKIHPGEPLEKNLYDLSEEEAKTIPSMCASLQEAIDALSLDYEFLLVGNVFTRELLDSYIVLKKQEIERLNRTTHPIEFDMYYSQ